MNLPAKIQISDLWRWDGTVGRTQFVLWGFSLATVKYFLDSFVSQTFFHKSWTILEYFAPGYATAANPDGLTIEFYLTMLALSLPFVWTGSVLTIRRLRAAQLAPWLLLFFYVPVLNLVFFKILSWVPSVEHEPEVKTIEKSESEKLSSISSGEDESAPVALGPGEKWRANDGSALKDFLVAAALPIVPTLGLVYISILVLGSYGYGLFVALPFVISIAAPLIYAGKVRRSLRDCIAVSLTSMAAIYVGLLVFAFEGIVCLLMASPLALVIATGGGMLAYFIQKRHHGLRELPKIVGGLLVLVLALTCLEVGLEPRSPLYSVTTSVEVDAPPSVVWRHVVAFTKLNPPDELIFKAGVAYPIEAKIFGEGKGAVRHCIFSTGKFVEPITVWREPELLAFSVQEQALPMKEFSPYKDIHPPHMDGYLMSRKGQFKLAPTASGGTRLSGTTWYQNNMGPAPYWRLWSDQIIHAIHRRVLNHVRDLSQNDVRVIGSSPGS